MNSDCVTGYECADCGEAFQNMQEVNLHLDFSFACSSLPVQKFDHNEESLLDTSNLEDLDVTIPSMLRSIRNNTSINNSTLSDSSLNASWIDDDIEYQAYCELINAQSDVDKREFNCNYCYFKCNSATSLSYHKRLEHYEFECEVCNLKFSHRAAYKNHLKRHEKGAIERKAGVCRYCGQIVLKNLNSHVQCCGLRLKNDHLGQEADPSKNTVLNEWDKMGVDSKKIVLRYYCRIKDCNKFYNNIVSAKKHSKNTNLRRHEMGHGKNEHYECWYCKKSLNDYDDYSEHIVKCAKAKGMPYRPHDLPIVDGIVHIRF